MLVQSRGGSLRLVAQHDHALASGEMAVRWVGPSRGDPATFLLVAAVGLHDLAWRPLDESPRLDPGTGRPYAFDAYPLQPKLSAYRSGLDRMEAADPWIGLLGSRHYASFLDRDRAPGFLEAESRRRTRLGRELADRGRPVSEDRLSHDLAVLQLLDSLSLAACLTGPDVPDEERIPWLRGPFRGPGGRAFATRWSDSRTLVVDPFPFREPFEVDVPARMIPSGPYESPDALAAAWGAAEAERIAVRIRPD